MANFLELVNKRRSVRHYTSQRVEKEKLDYILLCARMAPSAVNRQPWHLVVVQSELQKQRVATCYHAKWLVEAPVYIVVCVDTQLAWTRQSDRKSHADIDAAIITEHICLAAAEQDLGTCWVCNFDAIACKEVLELDSNIQPIALIPVGYPADENDHRLSERKAISEIASFV